MMLGMTRWKRAEFVAEAHEGASVPDRGGAGQDSTHGATASANAAAPPNASAPANATPPQTLYVLAPGAASPMALEGTALAVWAGLSTAPRPEEDIVRGLAEQFGEPESRIAPQISAFLRQLESLGLVEAAPA